MLHPRWSVFPVLSLSLFLVPFFFVPVVLQVRAVMSFIWVAFSRVGVRVAATRVARACVAACRRLCVCMDGTRHQPCIPLTSLTLDRPLMPPITRVA
ncbi:hypothetical protein JB92DRAFT_269820 [Gautieria morchelliformis]|nr:hypothetical protein JB92DRAFT_269820 [Gautieria morchelliformis]